jgi:hypothetical protein
MKRFETVESVLQSALNKYHIDIGFRKSKIFKNCTIGSYEFDENDSDGIKRIFDAIKSVSYI